MSRPMNDDDVREIVHAVVGAASIAVFGYITTWLLFSQ